ncbi:MAG: integrase arm-type DNA-binding domain-containing protein [Pseudomonadota bacterium]
MPLNNTAIRKAKPSAKPVRMFDTGGLYLEISPAGGKWWRLKYHYSDKEKRISLGTYPDTTLAKAREKRDEARKLLADGIDPAENRKAQKAARQESAANSFEVLAREWHTRQLPKWSPAQAKKVAGIFENNVYPWIGKRPIAELKPHEILATLRRMEDRGANETARRALQYCGMVFRYAVATGRADRDIAADLKGALAPVITKHRATIIDPSKIGDLLRTIDGYQGTLIVKCALKLAPLVFVRPGELRKATWTEIDLERAEWNIPAERMKMREPHLVPLSSQAVAILRELHPLTGRGEFVFPGERSHDRPMSNNTLNAALRRLGYDTSSEITGHGFRAMARTILDEVLGIRPDFIEHQLAHAVRDPNGRAYNRTAHLAERKKMMQQWADYLDALKAGAKVIPLHGQAA